VMSGCILLVPPSLACAKEVGNGILSFGITGIVRRAFDCRAISLFATLDFEIGLAAEALPIVWFRGIRRVFPTRDWLAAERIILESAQTA
jgi:hypothetical protein